MSETPEDPGADTQMFRKFVDEGAEPSSAARTRMALVIGGVVLLVLVLLMIWLLSG